MPDPIDITANRRAQKWSRREQVLRVAWAVLSPSFRWSPRPAWGWRRMLLRLFGARIGAHVHVYPSVRVSIPWNIEIGDDAAVGDRAILYALGPIRIGERSCVSQGAHICAGTHDYRDPALPLVKASIQIGDEVWICADAFVGPGRTVGDRAIVGARAVVTRDVAPGSIVAGNPARVVKLRGAT